MSDEKRWRVTDNYVQKISNSGYQVPQIRKIILNWIKGYEKKKGQELYQAQWWEEAGENDLVCGADQGWALGQETEGGGEQNLITGFRTKIIERVGSKLKNLLPYRNLWAGCRCLRVHCITWSHEGEKFPACTKRNVLYENVCHVCTLRPDMKKAPCVYALHMWNLTPKTREFPP